VESRGRTTRLYRLKPDPFQELDVWLAQFAKFWSTHIDASNAPLDRMDQQHQRKVRRHRGQTRERDKEREMKIKLTSVYVNDRRSLRFYYRSGWLREEGRLQPRPFAGCVASSETRTHRAALASNSNPAAKATNRHAPAKPSRAAMFFTDEVQADYERMKHAAPSSPCRQRT